jgi:hypothetical protein
MLDEVDDIFQDKIQTHARGESCIFMTKFGLNCRTAVLDGSQDITNKSQAMSWRGSCLWKAGRSRSKTFEQSKHCSDEGIKSTRSLRARRAVAARWCRDRCKKQSRDWILASIMTTPSWRTFFVVETFSPLLICQRGSAFLWYGTSSWRGWFTDFRQLGCWSLRQSFSKYSVQWDLPSNVSCSH